MELEEPLTSLQAISLGITARSMSGALLIPITVVKTRFEVFFLNYVYFTARMNIP